MGIKFNDFIKTVKKGAGIVKRDYKNVGKNIKGLARETIEKRKAEKGQKKSYNKLIATSSKKDFIKKYGEVAYNKAMAQDFGSPSKRRKYKKTEKKMKEKYKHLK